MTDKPIEPGKTVWGPDGTKASYVGPIQGHHLVHRIATFTGYDGDTFEDESNELVLWPKVFPKAPVAVMDARVAELTQEVEVLTKRMHDRRKELLDLERDHVARLKALKRFEPLKHLDEVMDGRFTHVVEKNYGGVEIKTWADAAVYRDNYDRKDHMRLLTLKPDPDGAILWHLTKYSDGSGGSNVVFPCLSEEEAYEVATKVLIDSTRSYGFMQAPQMYRAALTCAEKLGLTLPDDMVAMGQQAERDAALKEIASAEAQFNKAKMVLDGLQEKLEPPPIIDPTEKVLLPADEAHGPNCKHTWLDAICDAEGCMGEIPF